MCGTFGAQAQRDFRAGLHRAVSKKSCASHPSRGMSELISSRIRGILSRASSARHDRRPSGSFRFNDVKAGALPIQMFKVVTTFC